MKIEFVSYKLDKKDRAVLGQLTLRINDREVKFGRDYSSPDSQEPLVYPRFWYVTPDGKLFFDKYDLPERLQPFFDEIKELFLENVSCF